MDPTRCRLAATLLVSLALAAGCGGSDTPNRDAAPRDDAAAPADASPDDVATLDGDPRMMDDAGPDAPLGPPIEPAPGEGGWQWVPVPESRCMNGTPTGIGVSFSRGSDRLLIVLEGGGACFTPGTCAFGTIHQDGFDEGTFRAVMRLIGSAGVLNRRDVDNPFNSWNYVFVPYCTGDVHAGNNPAGPGGRMHVGYVNLGHYLRRVVPTFASASRVVIAGSSAGGVGAAYNYHRTQQAFGAAPVYLIDDSGPVLSDTYLRPCLQAQWRAAWNLDATLPPDCAACRGADGGGLVHMAAYLAERYPPRRFALISATRDAVIRRFFSYGLSPGCDRPWYFPPEDFEAGLLELRRTHLAGVENFRGYLVPSEAHTYLMNEPLGATRVNGVRLTDWLRAMVYDDAAWTDVLP